VRAVKASRVSLEKHLFDNEKRASEVGWCKGAAAWLEESHSDEGVSVLAEMGLEWCQPLRRRRINRRGRKCTNEIRHAFLFLFPILVLATLVDSLLGGGGAVGRRGNYSPGNRRKLLGGLAGGVGGRERNYTTLDYATSLVPPKLQRTPPPRVASAVLCYVTSWFLPRDQDNVHIGDISPGRGWTDRASAADDVDGRAFEGQSVVRSGDVPHVQLAVGKDGEAVVGTRDFATAR